jgi:hypothetical protein
MHQFDWYAAASRFTLKGAEVQVGIFMFSLGPEMPEILDVFGLSAEEEKVVATIWRRFEGHFTPVTNISLQTRNFMSIWLKHRSITVNLVSWKIHW